jgi:hypothetical protein
MMGLEPRPLEPAGIKEKQRKKRLPILSTSIDRVRRRH